MTDESDPVTVSTRIPKAQRDRWREDADALDMSQSEFVRAMVQAGRRGFSSNGANGNAVETDVAAADPRGSDLRTAILDVLRREGELEWAEIADAVIGDVEDDVEGELLALQARDEVRHSPQRGTYAVAGEPDGE